MRIQINLPYPPKELSPNKRVHYMTRANAVANYREAAGWAAKEAMQLAPGGEYPFAILVNAYVIFREYDRRRRDPDNHMAMLKPVWDGFKDAGLLVDDNAERLTIHPPSFYVISRTNPRGVLVTLNDAVPTTIAAR